MREGLVGEVGDHTPVASFKCGLSNTYHRSFHDDCQDERQKIEAPETALIVDVDDG